MIATLPARTTHRTTKPQTRRERAQAIVSTNAIQATEIAGIYLVQSQSDKLVWYQVDTDALTCECEDRARGNHCMHLIAGQLTEQNKRTAAIATAPKRTEWIEELDLI